MRLDRPLTSPLSPAVLAALLGLAASASAQPPGMDGPAPVGYTEAREHALRPTVRLSGSVEARRSATVASEVEGLVTDLVAREGDRVQRGAPLARLRQQALELRRDARRAEIKEAKARRELARRNLQRARDLFGKGVISRQELDNALSEETAWSGRVESLEAAIAQVEDDLARSAVAAPFTGVVVEEHTQVGEWIGVGDPVVDLVDLAELEVVVEVPERHFRSLEQGTPTEVYFDALPGLSLQGRINAIIPRADRQTRTFPVKVRFANPKGRVGVGMLAQVDLPVGGPARTVVVPKDAVVRQGAREVVFRIGDGGAVEPVQVEPGAAVGSWVAVDGSLAAGDRVVTRGNERLRPGQPVEPSPVDYEPPGSPGGEAR